MSFVNLPNILSVTFTSQSNTRLSVHGYEVHTKYGEGPMIIDYRSANNEGIIVCE